MEDFVLGAATSIFVLYPFLSQQQNPHRIHQQIGLAQ